MDAFRLHRVSASLAGLVGLIGTSGGIYSLVNPVAFSGTLGIPITSPTSPAIPFISFAGVRNLSSGIAMLTLLYTGQRKAVGVALMTGIVAALLDAWICVKYGALQGKAAGHGVMGVVLGVLGAVLYRD